MTSKDLHGLICHSEHVPQCHVRLWLKIPRASCAASLLVCDWPMQECLTHPVGSWPAPPSDKQPFLWLSGNVFLHISLQLLWVLHCDHEAQFKEGWNKAHQGCGIFISLRDYHLGSHTESYWKSNFYISYLSLCLPPVFPMVLLSVQPVPEPNGSCK